MFTFTIVTNNSDEALLKAQEKVKELNGTLEDGKFEIDTIVGKFKGNYTVLPKTISIEITKKPYVVSESRVIDTVTKYFKE